MFDHLKADKLTEAGLESSVKSHEMVIENAKQTIRKNSGAGNNLADDVRRSNMNVLKNSRVALDVVAEDESAEQSRI